MFRFAERNPRLWGFLEQASAVILSGLLFWVFVLVLPAGLVGLFAAMGALLRPGGGDTLSRFWHGVRRTFGRALLLGLLDLLVLIVLGGDVYLFWSLGTTVGRIVAIVFGSLTGMVAMVNVFVWPLLAWYPQPLGPLIRRAFLLSAAHPFLALGGLAGAVALNLFLLMLPGTWLGLMPILAPGLTALVIGLAAWQAMKRYTGPDDEFAE